MEKKQSKVKAVIFAIIVTVAFLLLLSIAQSVMLVPDMLKAVTEQGITDGAELLEVVSAKEGLMANAQFLSEIVLIVIMGLWYYLGYIKKEKLAGTYEPVTKKLSNGNNLAFVIFGCLAASSLVYVLYYVLEAAIPDQVDQFADTMSSLADNWKGLTAVMIGAPIAEELTIRGIISKKTKRAFGVVGCVIISALCFSAIHANLIQGVYTLPLGLFYGFLAYKFNSVIPSMLCHIYHNSLAGIVEETIGVYGVVAVLVVSCVAIFYFGKKAEVLKKTASSYNEELAPTDCPNVTDVSMPSEDEASISE
jgi:membrane protease YdiL (CAAX protease family)